MRNWKKEKYLSHVARPICTSVICKRLYLKNFVSNSVRFGYYPRRWEKVRIQRFRCKLCLKTFSLSTYSQDFKNHKPYLNAELFCWFASAGSQRRAAINLGVNRKTIVSKFKTLGSQSELFNEREREFLKQFSPQSLDKLQFDEMEGTEHTKLKPLSIPIVVDARSRKIIGFEVCRMPAKGRLAQKSLHKYGYRADERDAALSKLFQRLKPIISQDAVLISDSKPQYPKHVKEHFPNAKHIQELSRAGCVAGQGELKKIGNDPLFSFNHTAAMFRANVNRLFRRTWNTTKKPEHLKYHLEIYARYHNTLLIHPKDSA